MSAETKKPTRDLAAPDTPLLKVDNLKKSFKIKKGLFHPPQILRAVDGISFQLGRGRTIGLVGESGCGKSTLGRTIIRLYEPDAGRVHFQNQDFSSLKGAELRSARRQMQMIFQDPYASLDPRMTVARILEQPFRIHQLYTAQERREKILELIEHVGLQPSFLNRYPHEFSGGQRQRISIARALTLNPQLVIADEPVSALDVSIQAQILNLLSDLQEKFDLTYLFISHDLGVIEHMSDEVAVMYLGKIVEQAPRSQLFTSPQHPYTQMLLEAIPQFGQGKRKTKPALRGDLPSPLDIPKGCAFHPRCPHKMDICSKQTPRLLPVQGQPNHLASCHLVHPTQRLEEEH